MLTAAIEASGIEELESLLEGLVRLNLSQLRRGLCPPLYQANVRYRREPAGREDWQSALRTYRIGYGDCEDLASYLAASYRLVGVQARAKVKDIRPGLKHVVCELPDGTIEDPSAKLGMRGKG